jgi:uncharacterized protein (TIGR03437 family)
MRMRSGIVIILLFGAALVSAQSPLPRPAVPENGITNGASFDSGPIAPGSIISIFGSNLGLQMVDGATTPRSFAATEVPVGASLGGHSVVFRNPSAAGAVSQNAALAAPLFFVSGLANPNQINAQVPWELAGQQNAEMIVRVNDGAGGMTESEPVPVAVSPAGISPAVFTFGAAPRRAIAVNVSETADVIVGSLAQPAEVVPGGQPALPGTRLILYANGLGPVEPAAATGDNSLNPPLLRTATQLPAITVGGRPAIVEFSGLAPEFVGVYQVNLLLPEDLPPGNEVPIRIELGGLLSRDDVTIAVRASP